MERKATALFSRELASLDNFEVTVVICPHCGFESPEDMRFCGACGTGLDRPCPRCDFVNPPDFRFCGRCGCQMPPPGDPVAEDVDLIERNLPSDLREKGLSEKAKLEGERRRVTVMFCDIAGFTPLSETIGAERAYALMKQLYELLIQKVNAFEGTVNELTGDGVLALFGAPIALEDAPQRAIRSALAIHREMSRFNDQNRRGSKLPSPVRMRIGINTGPVVVGSLGTDLRIEFKAVGDTVNLAARMESMADPGTTLVTEETYNATEGLFRFEALGHREVKGKKDTVPAYRVVTPSNNRTRFDVSAQRGLTPFVGRERELELLLDGYERAREGRGQAVSVVAEAGLGKSRLLHEFKEELAGEDLTFLEGRCLSYCRGLTYYPLIDLLRTSFHIAEEDDEGTIERKLQPALGHLGIEASTIVPWLLDLLAPSSSRMKGSMTPEAWKNLLVHALTDMLLTTSERRPLVLAVEDLHWIDRSSEELLTTLLNSISASRILMLFTYRPEYLHTWGARSYHSQLTLNRLSNRETLEMAHNQLGADEIDESLEGLILEKTEGVPFFVEEFLKSMRDLGFLRLEGDRLGLAGEVGEISVPATIQDVLRARIDILPEGAKAVLRTASVVGREMSHELLQQLTESPEEDLLANLSILKDNELLYERGVYPHSTYLFKHALTREVVHDSILSKNRKLLHRRAGQVIEALFSRHLEEHYGVLAEHFIAGEDFLKGAEYSRLAARSAHQSGAFPDAIEYAKKGVWCLSHFPDNDETLKRTIDARTTLAGYILILGRPHEAKEAVAPIAQAALDLDYRQSWPAIFGATGLYELFAKEDYTLAMEHLEKVLATPLDNKSSAWHWFAAYYLGAFHAWMCEFDQTQRYLERATSMSEAAGRLEGVAVGHATIGLYFCFQGQLDRASFESGIAQQAAKGSHNPTAQALTQAVVGIIHSSKGLHSDAREHLQTAVISTSETAQTFWRSMALTYLGDALYELSEYDEAQTRYRQGIATLEGLGDLLPSWQSVMRLRIARARAAAGNTDIRLEDLRDWRRANRLRFLEGLTARLIAQVLLTVEEPELEEAQRWVETAIAADRANGLQLDLAHDHVCLAQVHQGRDDRKTMRLSLERARDLFRECGSEGYFEEMERRLGAPAEIGI
jgi:class 3 adenylate cyclase/tetratricopeptide (TPR) repeat protein